MIVERVNSTTNNYLTQNDDRQNILSTVVNTISKYTNVPPKDIKSNMSFEKDLHINPYRITDVITQISKELSVGLNKNNMNNVTNINQLVDYIILAKKRSRF